MERNYFSPIQSANIKFYYIHCWGGYGEAALILLIKVQTGTNFLKAIWQCLPNFKSLHTPQFNNSTTNNL